MERPWFVILSGPPASGKTTLARPLATMLGLPLFEKDAIKESLADDVGGATREVSRSLGLASVRLMYRIAGELIDAGQSVMVESYFYRGLAEPELEPLVARSNALLVHCTASPTILSHRYTQRMTTAARHAIHEVGIATSQGSLTELRPQDHPLDLDTPRIIVTTTHAFPEPGQIATMARDLLDRPDHAQKKEFHWP